LSLACVHLHDREGFGAAESEQQALPKEQKYLHANTFYPKDYPWGKGIGLPF